jgi:alpha-mannosidase
VPTAPSLQVRLQSAIADLRVLGGEGLGSWRFQHPAQPGGESPGLDDNSWPEVRPEHQWQGDNTAAWYRIRITVPERIGAAPVPGGPLVLRIVVDDDGEIYVDGKLAQKFHWDQGKVTLTDDARPGQTFMVAVKVINQGGPGALTAAALTYEKLEPVRQPALDQAGELQLAGALLSQEAKPSAAAIAAVEASLSALNSTTITADADQCRAAIEASAKALGPLEPLAKQYSLYLVGHAHIDMNWLWLWPETVQVCHDTWWQAIRFMEEFPDFHFSQSQPGAYAAIKEKYPDLFAEIQKYVKEGRWELTTATWVEGDTNMASGEALVRQMLASRGFCEANFGKWTQTLWLPDNFGHAWTIPMIFSDGGIRNFYFMRGGAGPPLFWWQSADGSRLACFNNDNYDWTITPDVLGVPLSVASQVGVKDAMIPYGVGDHGGGPTRHDINTAVALAKRPLAPQIKFARADEFFRAALAQGQTLPTVGREMGFLCRGCYTAHSDIKYQNRKLENLLPTAETAAVAAGMLAGRRYDNTAFMGAWHNVLFNQFHDIMCGTAIHDSYKYSLDIAHESEVTADREISESLAALAGKVKTSGEGDGVLLWNRLGWERKGVVEAAAPEGAEAGATMLAVGADGKGRAAQILDMPSANGPRKLVAIDGAVPACGWAVYHLQTGKAAVSSSEAPAVVSEDGGGVTIDNGLLRIVVDKASGAISSVQDLAARRELVPAGQMAGQLQILWEHPDGSAWDIGPIQWTKPIAKADSVEIAAWGPLAGGVLVKQTWNKSSFTTWIGLKAGAHQVDFRLVADWQEIGTQADGGPMLKVAFPTTLSAPVFTCDIPFGSVARAADGQDVPSQMWMDLTDVKTSRSGGYRPVTVDLTRYFNQDGFATEEKPGDGDFDTQGVSFPAAIFASARGGLMDFRGLPWRVPPTGPGQNNCVRCDGQRIELPKAAAGGVTVFGASAPSAASGMARLVFSDGTEKDVNLGFADWCFPPEEGEEIAARAPYRMGPAGHAPAECHIFARTLNIPAGKTAVGLVLPRAAKVRVMAITLGPGVETHAIYGEAVLNDCKYGVDSSGGTMRLSLLRSSYYPDPTPDVGVHEINYALVPHAGDWTEGGCVERPAWELNNPMPTVAAQAHEGDLAGAGSLVSLEPANLVLAAVKQAEDGKGLIVRWYDSAGRDTLARLRFGFEVAGARLTNAVEAADRGPIPVRGREVTVKTRAYGMVTVRVQPAPKRQALR